MEQQIDSVATAPRGSIVGVWWHRARALCALGVFVPLALFVGLPQYGWILLISRIKREDERRMQERLTAWFFFWNRVWMRLYWLAIGLRWEFVMDDESKALAGTMPMLVAANHYGAIDVLLLAEGAAKLGVPVVRAVAMRETASWPIIGGILKRGKTAFMRRQGVKNGRNLDVEDLELFGCGLHQDKAWAAVFVEGHVFLGTPGEGYRNVLKPKTRGLQAMLRNMPEHPLLVVTFVWHDYDVRKGLWIAAVPPGSKVTVLARVIRQPNPETIDEWLPAEWQLVDGDIDRHRRAT